ncbi:MAG: putative short-chain dehydrogenase/reductase [Myxococcales bacterium]|nr:putative short-chain dehydrogenase/reductase [Myxococcales bacterium]
MRVVVTGASSGIGAEIARQYAATGARVALFARRRQKLEDIAAECLALGAAETSVLEGDTTDFDRVRSATATIVDTWGGVDRAFLNAGGYGVSDSAEMQRARELEWTTTGFSAAAAEAVMRVNYIGVTYWLETLLPIMREQRAGTIAVTGAQTADRGFPAHGPYAATKAALRALCDSLRPDALRYGITLALLEPGCVESELTEKNCCDSMPFLQPTAKAVTQFIAGVEHKRAVVRWPAHASLSSKLAASIPRAIFDRWAMRKLPRV